MADLTTRVTPQALGVAVACLGFFTITLDATIVNVAVPSIGRQFGGGVTQLQWVVNSYVLVFAALLISAGALSDRIGANRAFGIGLGLFTLSSLACGLAPSPSWLITARVVQGAAAAMILPSSLSLIRQILVEPAALARGIALWATGGGAAVSIGPLLGGLLTSELGWQAIFLVNLPIGIAGAAALRRVPRSKPRYSPMDLAGQISAAVALVGVTFAITEGGRYTVPALAVFVVAAVAFFSIESRVTHPAIPLALFRLNPFIAATSTGFVMNLAYFGLAFVLTLYFQQIRGATPVITGLMFIPMTVFTMVGNLLAGRLVAKYDTRIPLTAGQLVEALGFCTLLFSGPSTPIFITLAALVPIGLGAGLTSPPMTTTLLRAVEVEHAGAAGGVLGVVRQVGGVLGVAIFGALVAVNFDMGMRLSLVIAIVSLLITAALSFSFVRPVR